VQYQLTGSQIVVRPAPGQVLTLSTVTGKSRTVTADGKKDLIYDADSDAWYYGSVRSSNEVDLSTLAVTAA